jgi:long-chain acyl-CoA synthetase
VEERPWHRFYRPDIPRDFTAPPATLPAFLEASAARYPRRPAVVLATPVFDAVLSYAALARESNRFAHALRGLGIGPGDRVAVALPNLPQYAVAAYGVFKAGAVLVQVNPLYRGDELAFLLRDSGARVLVTLGRLYREVEPLRGRTSLDHVVLTQVSDYFPPLWRLVYALREARRQGDVIPRAAGVLPWRRLLASSPPWPLETPAAPGDVAVLQYTGGTTGRPRGAMLSHRALAANALQAITWFPGLREGQECILCVAPLFHAYGLLVLNGGLRLGATLLMVLMKMFDARLVARQVPRWKPTIFPGVPAMYLALTRLKDVSRYDLQSIRLCLSGAAPLPPDVAEAFERLTGARVVEAYGLTEAGPLVTANPIWEGGERRPGSIGIPLSGTDARIVDLETGSRVLPPEEVGELVVRGPQIMEGYWNAPDETRAVLRDGWLFTGDVAKMDPDGFFYIVDRKKDLIKVGGLNVYPREVEDVLMQHPLVKDAAVVGVTHPVRGETIVAHVTLRPPGGDPATVRTQLREFLRARLPSYMIPRRIEVVDTIPTTLIGKPLRRLVRETARTQLASADDPDLGHGSLAPVREGGPEEPSH